MSTDSAPDRYRRRHRWPILVFALVMLLGAGIIWFQILRPGPAAATGCNQPSPATVSSSAARTSGSAAATAKAATTSAPTAVTSVTTSLGSLVAASTLSDTRPADPSTLELQVFNAGPTSGEAGTVTSNLQSVGFSSIAAASNDPLYPNFDLICQEEIRFGQAGLAEARTVLIVAPCAQLVMDNRIDASVDLALGARFAYAPVTDAIKAQLTTIHNASAPPAVIEGQTAAPKPLASIPPLPTANCSGTTTAGASTSSG